MGRASINRFILIERVFFSSRCAAKLLHFCFSNRPIACVTDRSACYFFHLFDNLYQIVNHTNRCTSYLYRDAAHQNIRPNVFFLLKNVFRIHKFRIPDGKIYEEYIEEEIQIAMKLENSNEWVDVLLWRLILYSVVWPNTIRHEITHCVYSNFVCRWRYTTNLLNLTSFVVWFLKCHNKFKPITMFIGISLFQIK